MSTSSIKNKIKNIRELKNYTQEYMADQLGITQAGYSKFEKGKADLSYSKLVEIARIFGLSVEGIINFDTQKYFNSFNNVNGNYNGNILINPDNHTTLNKLYEDKIVLLEKLLKKTDSELKRYKEKYGEL
ncbi:XRE family transcriptional regulator [Flavobacterium cheongpyeongense]|uniref:XRE family transcriptional regulator n=1 Tax=Flavobacterium cheongpyeongense TaxID=2212651 RepID=A0A2V4BTH0_9FLAO|nr:helix-turn-helix transcriptional regulator [Flavobacterium cheongpyeongense]PXY40980.1 XRE family transcriptional regulator [Flavobacterium cheongpyeongense]